MYLESVDLCLIGTFLASLIIAHFDGSFRNLSDPGFPTLGPMAACAATLSLESGEFRIGGRILSYSNHQTSGVAEFEGLILGLEGLLHLSREGLLDESTKVVFYGDCKTVIQQMTERSQSRKLQQYHKRAISIRCQLPCSIHFQHIPRCENAVCDRLSSMWLSQLQLLTVNDVLRNLESIIQNLDDHTSEINARLKSILNRYFGVGCPSIVYSQRPLFYRIMACIAVFTNDFDTLLALGQRLQLEVRQVWSKAQISTGEIDDVRKSLLVEALGYQLHGLNDCSNREACRLEQKHAHLLERRSDVLTDSQQQVFACRSISMLRNVTFDLFQILKVESRSRLLPSITKEYVIDEKWKAAMGDLEWFTDEQGSTQWYRSDSH